MNTTNKILIILLSLLVVFYFLYLISDTLILAYQSVEYSCLIEKGVSIEQVKEIASDNGLQIDGSFSVRVDNNIISTSADIYNASPEVIKHEMCHKRQFEQNRLFSCNNKILKYFNELECYLLQEL